MNRVAQLEAAMLVAAMLVAAYTTLTLVGCCDFPSGYVCLEHEISVKAVHC